MSLTSDLRQVRISEGVRNKILILDVERLPGITEQYWWDRGDLKNRYVQYETVTRMPRTTIVCAKWYHDADVIQLTEWDSGGRKRFLRRVHNLLSQADIVVGHYIDEADVPWLKGDLHSEIGASRTAELVHVIVQKALDDAVAEGVATRNVAALVDKPEYRKKKRNGFPADVAQHIIHTAFQVCDEPDAVRIAAGFLTGARRGELLGLRWPYVDNPAQGWITIAWQLQSETRIHGCGDPLPEPSPLSRPDRMPKKPPYWPCGKTRAWACPQSRWDLPAHFEYQECEGSLLFTRPKTDAGWREVPLLPPLYVAMQKLRTDNPHDLVWHKEGKPIDPRSDYDVWRGVFRAAGVIGPTESLPPHNSRHTTSTLLRAAGVDEQTRMEILGHASVDAQRIYAHADRARHLEAMQGLSELLPSTFALETK
ncbi:tyrosine integrase [Mycobacterium phage Cornie]|uniref:Tyrosine integrase n=1 Tax=Mycobacterium phage Cornie TaxID=2704043 RepID=A0A6G6XJY6_9CAUD|nr:tyrosine integrase [Mycobacterium phage Cornie]QIG58412.1 tyrosine integrase [Mycobacterium phage Cornie]